MSRQEWTLLLAKIKTLLAEEKTKEKGGDVKNNNVMLFGAIVVLAGMILLVAFFKNDVPMITQNPQGYNGYQYANGNGTQQIAATSDQKIEVLKQQYSLIDQAAQKIWERTKWNEARMALLATINNHNTVVLQNNLPKSELILLNEDWTIDRMPNRIALDDTDKQFLQQFIKK